MDITLLVSWVVGTLVFCTVAAILAKRFGAVFLAGFFTSTVMITVVVSSKLIVVGPFVLSVGIVIFSISFFLTDVLSEFWGKEVASKAVWAGLLGELLMVFVVTVAIAWEPASFWEGQDAYKQTLGQAWRIALASIVAYIFSQSHDVWAYHFWKKKFQGRFLWIRNNFSTGVSQIIDSLIFFTIAFYGIVPVIDLIVGAIVVKIIIAVIDTPFLYAVRWYFEKVPPFKHALKPEPLSKNTVNQQQVDG